MAIRNETQLYSPIKSFLEQQGYVVKSEVNGCDVVAIRSDEVVVIELKSSFNLDLVLQGIDRQTVADDVYLAVEAPRSLRRGSNGHRWEELKRLCRRLELGLITVKFSSVSPIVEVVCVPSDPIKRRSKNKRVKLLDEFNKRSGDHNTGGSSKRPIVTAYRERALSLAACLRIRGSTKVGELRDATGVSNAYAIVHRNVYGWFVKEGRALYGLSNEGVRALERYADVVSGIRKPSEASPRRKAALILAERMYENGPQKLSELRAIVNINRVETLLNSKSLGWFVRVSTGVYGLSEIGLDEFRRQTPDDPPKGSDI